MFGMKKKEQIVKTYVDGRLQAGDEIPVPRPPDAPAQEPLHQPVIRQFECEVCRDYGWYVDSVGVCHNCPRCNPSSMKKKAVVEKEPDYDAGAEEAHQARLDKPRNNLYEFRTCKKCGARNELHKRKIKWQCEKCKADMEGY